MALQKYPPRWAFILCKESTALEILAAKWSDVRLQITPQLEKNYNLLQKEEAEMEWTAHLTRS